MRGTDGGIQHLPGLIRCGREGFKPPERRHSKQDAASARRRHPARPSASIPDWIASLFRRTAPKNF
ncbi:MAG: hypothetical protein LBE06_01760 [Azoarcus sp.]|nr:hypothetical protein [Azoarcus sp.]